MLGVHKPLELTIQLPPEDDDETLQQWLPFFASRIAAQLRRY